MAGRKPIAGLIRIEDAAALTGYCVEYFKQLSREGKVPSARKRGRIWLYDPDALLRWIRQERVLNKEAATRPADFFGSI